MTNALIVGQTQVIGKNLAGEATVMVDRSTIVRIDRGRNSLLWTRGSMLGYFLIKRLKINKNTGSSAKNGVIIRPLHVKKFKY